MQTRRSATHRIATALILLATVSPAVLAAQAVPGAASARRAAAPGTVEVDFGQRAYFPLVKERMGLFQEAEIMQAEEPLIAKLPLINELPGSTFRLLGSFGDGVRFNSPSQVYGTRDAISVRANPAIERSVGIIRSAGKLPILSWYGTPPMLRGPRGDRGAPTDLPAYANAMARLAQVYARGGPLIWEIMNEPNLDQFFRTDDNVADYSRIFAATARAVRAADPDILIAGPSLSDEADPIDFERFVRLSSEGAGPPPVDYFSFHVYRNHSAAEDKFAIARNAVRDRFDTAPFLITEYENFHPADTFETKKLRETATGALFFFNHARMLAEQTDVGSVTWNRFMTTSQAGARANPGGLISYEGDKRAIYNAFTLYDWLPADRAAVHMEAKGFQVLAGADLHNAGIVLWNPSPRDAEAVLKVRNLPAAVARNGRVRLYRIDARHASGADGAPPDLVSEEEQSVAGDAKTLSLRIAASSVTYVRFDDRSGRSLEHRQAFTDAKFVRSWSYVPRVARENVYVSEGNYGTVNPQAFVLRTGTNTRGGQGIAGLVLDRAPKTLWARMQASDVKRDGGANDLMALRIDYWNGRAWSKSVLFHGGMFDPQRSQPLPWGKGGVAGDVVVQRRTGIGDGKVGDYDLDRYAPSDWDKSRRRVLVSTWTAGTGIGAQTVTTLGDRPGE